MRNRQAKLIRKFSKVVFASERRLRKAFKRMDAATKTVSARKMRQAITLASRVTAGENDLRKATGQAIQDTGLGK